MSEPTEHTAAPAELSSTEAMQQVLERIRELQAALKRAALRALAS